MDSSIWLQLETKVRVLIKDLIEPTVRRVSDSSKLVEKLSKQQTTVIFKLEDVDAAVANIQKRLTTIDEFSKRVMEFEGTQSIMETRFHRDREELRSEITLFAQKQESLEENFQVMERQRELIRNEIATANQTILTNKFELEEKVMKLNGQCKEMMEVFERKVRLIDVSYNQMVKDMDKISKDLAKTHSVAVDATRATSEHSQEFKRIRKKIEKVVVQAQKDVEKLTNMSLNNSSDIRECSKEIKRVENDIKSDERIIFNEIKMTDPFYNVIHDLKQLKALANYDKDRLSKIDTLNNSDLVKKAVENISNKAQELIERPLPPDPILRVKSLSDTSTKKRRRKRRKDLKKQIAMNISQAVKGISKQNSVNIETSEKDSVIKVINNNLQSIIALKQNEVKRDSIVIDVEQFGDTQINKNEPLKKFEIAKKSEADAIIINYGRERSGSVAKSDTVPKAEVNLVKTDSAKRKNEVVLLRSDSASRKPEMNMGKAEPENRKNEENLIKSDSASKKNDLDLIKSDSKNNEVSFSSVLREAIQKVTEITPPIELTESFSDNSSDDSQDFIDFTPMIEQVKIQLQQESLSIYTELKALILSSQVSASGQLELARQDLEYLISSIKLNHEEYNSHMKNKISEIELLIQQAIYECNASSAQRKRDFTDYAFRFKSISASFEACNKQAATMTESIESLSRSIDCLTDFCKVSISLQSQDEQDSESIFLMGSKPKRQKPVVSIDKRCLSCAGQSTSVISAFKIACLAYEPSTVQFQSRRFTRKELLKLQASLLPKQAQSPELDLSDDTREVANRTMLTSKQWRPLSVPPSRFSTLTSPNLRTPDNENLPLLRKSLKL